MRPAGTAAALLLGLAAAAPAHAQLVTTMVGRDGLELPCVTVGPLAPIAQEYCVRGTERQGAIQKSRLGWSGLAVGDDRRVAAVAAGSPAAQAGLLPGDTLVRVDDKPVRPTPGEIARRRLFGPRGGVVSLSLVRDGATLERRFKRGAAPEPADAPHSPNPLVGVHPLMNWRGVFVPCMGAGPLGPVVIAACSAKAQGKGFVKTDALGDPGFILDLARPDAAVVASVAPGSGAAEADVRPGDRLEVLDGVRLDTLPADDTAALLFGERGATRRVLAERGGRSLTVDLVLAAPPSRP